MKECEVLLGAGSVSWVQRAGRGGSDSPPPAAPPHTQGVPVFIQDVNSSSGHSLCKSPYCPSICAARMTEKASGKDRFVVDASSQRGLSSVPHKDSEISWTHALSSRALRGQSSAYSWRVLRLRKLLLVLIFWERTYPVPDTKLASLWTFTATTDLSFGEFCL